MKELVAKINLLKKEKNAIVLAHCYQNIEIDSVADYVGDSLQLSRKAQESDAQIIIFAGVYFMAQSAKILSPQKKVIIPRQDAGCPMADMITPEKLTKFNKQNGNHPIVCYINSTAEVKAMCDICCTSSNAVDIVNSLESETILFVPDKNLGAYVQSKLPHKKIICFEGFCPIHMNIDIKILEKQKEKYPNALIISHPECQKEVIENSDFTGSTTAMINFVKKSKKREFIIVTEQGVVQRLMRDCPDKNFYHIQDDVLCKDMKKTSLEDIYNALLNETNEIKINEDIRQKAKVCIDKMLKNG